MSAYTATLSTTTLESMGVYLLARALTPYEQSAGRFARDNAPALLSRPGVFKEWYAVYTAATRRMP
jgi:hypothetical protein